MPLVTVQGLYDNAIFATKLAGGATFLAGLALWYYQNTLIYPASFPQGSRTEVWKPSRFGLDSYEDIDLTAPDGTRLKAYLMLHQSNIPPSSRPTLLFLHANAGNMGHRLPIAKVFINRMRMNVLMLSYRGYGLSEGSPSEQGLRMDAQTALDYISSHPQLERTPKILYGQSIGGAVTLDLASRNQNSISAVVVENTFTSLPKLVPKVMPIAKPFLFLLSQYWPSIDKVKTFRKDLPILFLSGQQDEMIPPSQVQELFDACTSEKKEIKRFENGDHNSTCVEPDYFESIARFLQKHIVSRSDSFDPERMHAEEELKQDGAEAGSRLPVDLKPGS